MPKTPDPTKDVEFQSVVKHFLNTKPTPHAEQKKKSGKKSKPVDR